MVRLAESVRTMAVFTIYFFLGIDEIVQDNFICSIPNAVHPGNPFHLILRFQLLGNALLLCQLRNKLLLHFLCLTVNFFQVGVQRALHEHYSVECLPMLP